MPSLRVPPEFKDGVEALRRLQSSQVDELIGSLRRAPAKFYREDLADGLRDVVKTIAGDDVESITQLLASLEYVRANADAPMDQFISDLAVAFERDHLPTTTVDGASMLDRVRQLLEVPSIAIPAKARTLLLEGRTLCRARLLTDIRPVFDAAEAPSRPEAALIVHNLRITYHDGNTKDTKDFIVSLDSNDLTELQNILERAKAKERSLESMLASAGTPYLKIE